MQRAPVKRGERDAARQRRRRARPAARSSPRRETTRTRSPSSRPAARGVERVARTASARRPRRSSAGEWPVRVIVCHWSATRPVVSSSGKSASGVSAGVGVRRRGEARAAVGRREAAVLVQAHGALVLADACAGHGHCSAALAAQALVRDAGHVARPPGGAGGELVEDRGAVGPGERVAVAEVAGEPGDDLASPAWPRRAARRRAARARCGARSSSSRPPSPARRRRAGRRGRAPTSRSGGAGPARRRARRARARRARAGRRAARRAGWSP